MRNIIMASSEDRSDLFRATANKMNMQPAIVEKDLWVCYLLDYLFNRSEFSKSIIFKGGTSLSKAYHVIERFSEDVDLILDWRLIGYEVNEPWETRSNTRQDKFKRETIARTDNWLATVFVPSLTAGISEEMGASADVRVADAEETVLFAYPKLYESDAALDVVRLEIGPLAAWSPHESTAITPYVAEHYPQLFSRPSTIVATAIPERTFWEKATILHQEANRPESKAMPHRYARHYYDLYRLLDAGIAERAMAYPELLADVVAFKEKFYRTPWAKLSEAKTGTIKLMPPTSRLGELKADYDSMQPMLFGEAPDFDTIIASIAALEERINHL